MNQTITGTDVEQKSAYEIAIHRGEVGALHRSILDVLQVRGLAISNTHRARLLACDDTGALRDMLLKAVVVESAAALFSEL